MCIAPTWMKNPRYKAGKAAIAKDYRLKYIQVGCGKCTECRKKKAKEWLIRLMEEYKNNPERGGQFVTLTFSEEEGKKIATELESNDSEKIAKLAVKRFRERWRKKHGKSPRYFLITELGHKGKYIDEHGKTREKTERIHLHGIIFEKNEKFGKLKWKNEYDHKAGRISEELNKIWHYGNTVIGYSDIQEKTINYVTKYITKNDEEHEGYYGRILCSQGIGKGYTEKPEIKEKHKYIKDNTNTHYNFTNGRKAGLPAYYKNKLWKTYIREKIRIDYENKGEIWVAGTKHKRKDYEKIYNAYAGAQEKHTQLKLWGENKIQYEWRYGKKIKNTPKKSCT